MGCMHPEVKYIGFLMLLYAGTTSKLNFNYSIIKKVKMLKQGSQSAGNIYINGTSETLRNKKVISKRWISVHKPKVTNTARFYMRSHFGEYIAGIIDSSGTFNEKQELHITFNKIDISFAYFLKKLIGYGKVKQIKDKNIVTLVISKKEGIEKILTSTSTKFRTVRVFNQIQLNILNHPDFIRLNKWLRFKRNTNNIIDNNWLRGYTELSGNFCVNSNKTGDPVLDIQLYKEEIEILFFFQSIFGGTIVFSTKNHTYRSANDVISLEKVINYYDKYPLLSKNRISFLKWRKLYINIYPMNVTNKTI